MDVTRKSLSSAYLARYHSSGRRRPHKNHFYDQIEFPPPVVPRDHWMLAEACASPHYPRKGLRCSSVLAGRSGPDARRTLGADLGAAAESGVRRRAIYLFFLRNPSPSGRGKKAGKLRNTGERVAELGGSALPPVKERGEREGTRDAVGRTARMANRAVAWRTLRGASGAPAAGVAHLPQPLHDRCKT